MDDMDKGWPERPGRALALPLIGLGAVNVLDFALHAASGRLEPLRVSGNLLAIVIAGLVYVALRGAKARLVLGGAALIYLICNALWAVLVAGTLPPIAAGFIAASVILFVWSAVKAA